MISSVTNYHGLTTAHKNPCGDVMFGGDTVAKVDKIKLLKWIRLRKVAVDDTRQLPEQKHAASIL